MEVKDLEVKLASIEKDIKTFVEKAEAELKASGKVSEETKATLEKHAVEAKAVLDRLTAVEQKLTSKAAEDDKLVKTIGDMVIESEGFKSLISGAPRSGKVNIGAIHKKTAMVNATGLNQPLVQAFRVPGIVTPAMQPLRVRDLFSAVPVNSNLIEYVEEISYTSNAAPQGSGSSPQVFENVAKAESAMAFALKYQPVATVAHWIPVSRQLLTDSPALAGYINARLTYGLKLKEEDQLLNGNGTGANIKGITTAATAYETIRDLSADTQIDTIRHAIAQVEKAFYPADFVVLNPADAEKIDLIKTVGTASSGQYIFADPRARGPKTLWGRPVVEAFSIAAGYFLVGSSLGATIWDREDATVEVSREHADFFVKNMAAVLCEERLGLTVEVPKALVYGEFPQ